MAGTWYGTTYIGDDTNETVKGTNEPDYIDGYGGKDTLSGGGGNDQIEGGSGNDLLRGGDGDDLLYGYEVFGRDYAGGVDRLFGDAGNDTLSLTAPLAAGNTMDGGAGARDTAQIVFGGYSGTSTSQPIAFSLDPKGSALTVGGLATLTVKNVERLDFTGDTGADTITGGALDDLINGREGDDVLKGLGGNDQLNGGTGRQDIDGGTGFDTASFDLSAATDAITVGIAKRVSLGQYGVLKNIETFGVIHTGSGADTINMGNSGGTAYGHDGADTMTGGAGNDTLFGGAGADTLTGGAGDDALEADYDESTPYAAAANDVLDGGAGNDILWGGNGADALKGGDGNDYVGWTATGLDTTLDKFDGGKGTDVLNVSLYRLGLSSLDLALTPTGTTLLKLNGTTVAQALSVERLNVSEYGSATVTLTGGAGDDYVYTGSGNSRVKTLGGNDSVWAGTGSDTVDTGAGDDNASASVEGRDSVKTGAGNDTLNLYTADLTGSSGASGASSVYDLGEGVSDRLVLQEGASEDFSFDGARIKLGATTVASVLHYELLTFNGSSRGTSFTGTKNDDILNMAEGDDTAFGGNGNDTIRGGYGADTLDGGAGNDTMSGGDGNDSLNGGAGVDLIDFSDWGIVGLKITLKGATKSTVAIGSYQKDAFRNFESVNGSQAGDTITGDAQKNVLNGLGGADTLWGKGGADTFVFSAMPSAANVDRIMDFGAGDTIRLEGGLFGKLATAGSNKHLADAAFKDLGDKGAKLDASDRILYNHKTGALSFDADGSGATKAVQFAQIAEGKSGFADLTPSQFLVNYIEPTYY